MSTLSLDTSVTIYDDGTATNNPFLRIPDWSKHYLLSVNNPQADKYTILPGSSLTVFNGTDATSIDGTSQFNITLNPTLSSTYRVTWNGTGTAPVFRTDRSLTLSGSIVTITINNNATATFSINAGSFAAVQVGDTVFVPGPTTGDSATVFSVLNQGFWKVISTGTTAITLTRFAGQAFMGLAEVQTLASNAQVQAFSVAGVGLNDKVEISAGFSSVTWGTYQVTQITPKWFEFTSSLALPLENNVLSTATGLTFYSKSKKFIHVETDQDAAIRLNGDTSNFTRVSPIIPADSNNMSLLEKMGPTWSLVIVNRSPAYPLNAVVITAE